MLQNKNQIICFLSAFILLFSCKEDTNQSISQGTSTHSSSIKLTPIPANQSGIHFNNEIKELPNLNLFIWNFIYTGAGVAAGDLNNDGLPDLFFGGNLVDDKIYFNKGDFAFEDVTTKSGINPGLWTTGVTMADVNNDGFLDIYVCKNSPTSNPINNQNKLFVNNKNGTFTERAAAYGIADVGFSIQASFFDVDNDGDLDMYLVNQPFDDYARLINNPQQVINYTLTDRLFIMEKGVFVDRTEELNMKNSKFGLSISLGDFDLDGWTDFYVSNDYHFADHLYMNKKGQFKDEVRNRTGHMSFFSMGTDVADVDNDGHLDLMTLDMAFQSHLRSKTNMESMNPEKFWGYVRDGRHYQYAVNNLQINRGNGTFKEVAQLAGIAKTDWSAAPLFLDVDANGYKDLLVTNGILRDVKNNDFSQYVVQKYQGRIGPNELTDAMSKIPSNPVANLLYENKGDYNFKDVSTTSGFDFKGFSHGMAYADFDQDGKMDVVVNNMNAKSVVYKNTSASGNYLIVKLNGQKKNKDGLGTRIIAYHGEQQQVACMQTTRGFLSSSEPVVHFGFGNVDQIDSLKVIWDHRAMTVVKTVKTNQKLTIDFRRAKKIPLKHSSKYAIQLKATNPIDFTHQETTYDDFAAQVLLPYQLSQNGPFIATGDLNNDQLEDVFIGAAKGHPAQIFQQNKKGSFTKMLQPDLEKDKSFEDMEASIIDLDGDGDQDLLVSSGSNEFPENHRLLKTRIYLNDGKGGLKNSTQQLPNNNSINGQTHVIFDADGDGDMDIFVGGRLVSNQYPMAADSKLWINHNGQWKDETVNRADYLSDFGLVTDAVSDDIDQDGDQDLILVGEWMAPTLLMNENNQSFKKSTIDVAGTGIWWTINKGDFDQDGDTDFVLGNLGWNNKFGGTKKPSLEIFSNDFDNNGDHDIVLATSNNAKTYPVRGRECSSQEMPFILDKFPSYESFGKAELKDILSPDQLENSLHKKIETFSSLVLINNGNLSFSTKELPVACQLGPIKSFEVIDLNQDGFEDLIFGGNHFPTEVETSRYDALSIGFCLGDGKGNFNYTPHKMNTIQASMDLRDLQTIRLENGQLLLLAANNDDALKSYILSWELEK